ncbi:hypothetical protein ACH47Z_42245 [Streptomyces sp. NPDC020192]
MQQAPAAGVRHFVLLSAGMDSRAFG